MSNGGGPPSPLTLAQFDYTTIKSGDCITVGSYAGCIKVGSVYYWIERNENTWILNTGLPISRDQVSITSGVWDRCKDGGSYSYDGELGGWYDEGEQGYKWNGTGGGDVSLDEV